MPLSLINRIGLLRPRMVYTVFAACIGGPFLYGWNIACMSLPSIYIKAFINDSLSNHYNVTASIENEWNKMHVDWLFSIATMLFPVGGFMGASISAALADRLGRRRAIMATQIGAIIAGILYYLCHYSSRFEVLMTGRLTAGLASGAGYVIVPVYGMEIVPKDISASIGTCTQLFIALGNFAAHIFTQDEVLGSQNVWFAGMSCMSAFAAISFLLLSLPYSVESPRWLLTVRRRSDLAQNALQLLYAKNDVSDKVCEIRKANKATVAQHNWNCWRLLRNAFGYPLDRLEPRLTWPLIFVVTINACQQLTGINVLFFYSKTLFTTAGMPDQKTWTDRASLTVSAVLLLATLIALPMIESFSRRTMLLYPTLVLSVSILTQMVLSIINTGGVFPIQPGDPVLAILCLICFAIFILGFALGLAPIPNFIATELFEDGPRASAQALGGSVRLFFTIVVALLFETVLNRYFGNLSFLPFLTITLVCLIFFAIFLPETKDRQPAEVYASQLKCPCGRRPSVSVTPSTQAAIEMDSVPFAMEHTCDKANVK